MDVWNILKKGRKSVDPTEVRTDDLQAAGVVIPQGDPRHTDGINYDNLTPEEKTKYDAYMKTLQDK